MAGRIGQMAEVGERVAELTGRFEQFEKYEHDRWHKLNNDLQPLAVLPERLAIELGRLEGIFSGRLSSMEKDFEKQLASTIEKALRPITSDIAGLKTEVEALKLSSGKHSAIRSFAFSAVQLIISVIAAIAAAMSVKGG